MNYPIVFYPKVVMQFCHQYPLPEATSRERVTFAISINAQKKQNSSFELLLSKIGENSNDVLMSGE
jgi:hypothetical protein